MSPNATSILGFVNQAAMLSRFDTLHSFNDQEIGEKMVKKDSKLMKPISNKLVDWLAVCTTKLWHKDAAKDKERKVNAELEKALKPKAMAQANADVAMALDDDEARNKAKMALVRKEARAEAKKAVNEHTRTMRKKSLGGTIVEESPNTENGRKQGGKSNNSKKKPSSQQRQSSSNGTESSKSKKPKQSNKHKQSSKGKKKKVTFAEDSDSQPSGRSRGN